MTPEDKSVERERPLPRRVYADLWTPAERAIQAAVDEVEKAGADVRLTEAVMLLAMARECVADFVDGVEASSRVSSRQDSSNPIARAIQRGKGLLSHNRRDQ